MRSVRDHGSAASIGARRSKQSTVDGCAHVQHSAFSEEREWQLVSRSWGSVISLCAAATSDVLDAVDVFWGVDARRRRLHLRLQEAPTRIGILRVAISLVRAVVDVRLDVVALLGVELELPLDAVAGPPVGVDPTVGSILDLEGVAHLYRLVPASLQVAEDSEDVVGEAVDVEHDREPERVADGAQEVSSRLAGGVIQRHLLGQALPIL